MAFRDHDYPLLLPGIAWVLLSTVIGLAEARARGLTGVWIGVALVVAGAAVALAFAILSIAGGLLIVYFVGRRESAAKRKDGGPGEA
jgi:membrane protein implicated in regulation of membrane protease activity